MIQFKKIISGLFSGTLLMISLLFSPQQVHAESVNQTQIHFITINDNNDAILIESTDAEGNSFFGMVDSGEDTDGPVSSTNGVVLQGKGYEAQVIQFLTEKGVTSENFIFYIGTHAHSDHIGSADEIIREFRPSRVYIQKYSDEYIQREHALWDNQKIYNDMLIAADEVGATIIQTFHPDAPVDPASALEDPPAVSGKAAGIVTGKSNHLDYTTPVSEDLVNIHTLEMFLEENPDIETPQNPESPDDTTEQIPPYEPVHVYGAGNPVFSLGSATISIMNYEETLHSIPDANNSSLGVLVTSANGKTAFLGGDINNLADGYLDPATGLDTGYDESKLAQYFSGTGVDVLKLGHHGIYGSNTYTYLTAMNPQIAVITGSFNHVADLSYDTSIGGTFTTLKQLVEGKFGNKCKLYTTTWYSDLCCAVTIQLDTVTAQVPSLNNIAYSDYQQEGYYLQDGQLTSANGWIQYTAHGWIENSDKDGRWFYFQNSAYPVTGKWIQSGGKYYYLTKGGPNAINWYEVTPGKWYYFDEKGLMQTGWIQYNDKWYYCNNSGLMLTGWQQINNSWYYFSPYKDDSILLGELLTGWQQINNNWYYFSETGVMQIGWIQIENDWFYLNDMLASPEQKLGALLTNGWYEINNLKYYFNASGKWIENYISPGWKQDAYGWWYQNEDGTYPTSTFLTINNKKYYVDAEGYRITGWQQIDNDYYMFNSNGIMQTGWINDSTYCDPISGKWIPDYQEGRWMKDSVGWWYKRYDGSYPVNQWEVIDDNLYFFNKQGYMVTGWLPQNDNWYYLNSNGSMVTGWKNINKLWYYFDENGKMLTGWQYLNDSWYYLNHDGAMQTGWILQNQTYYYLYANGSMATNWLYYKNQWYFLNTNGSMCTGWQFIKGYWYYFNSQGTMQTGWLYSGGKWYYLHKDGAMQTGWLYSGGKWYYLDSNGVMQTGWKQIQGEWYYLHKDGSMATDIHIENGYIKTDGTWVP